MAHAVQEIKDLDDDAGFTYFTTLHQSLWNMAKDDLRWAKRGEGS